MFKQHNLKNILWYTMSSRIALFFLLALMVVSHGFAPISSILQGQQGSKRVSSTTFWGVSTKGPGETEKEPLSISTASRIELAKVIVSAAILYMSIQLNIEKALAKWMPDGLGVGNAVDAEDGVMYEDIYIGDGDIIQEGDAFEIDCKLFYNGFPVEIPAGSSSSSSSSFAVTSENGDNKSGNSNVLSAFYSKQGKNEKNIVGIMKGMEGLRVGGRRKIVVPPALAFGDEGLLPYIPPNANVLYDIKLISISNNENRRPFLS